MFLFEKEKHLYLYLFCNKINVEKTKKKRKLIFQNNFVKCKKYKYLPRNVATFHWLAYRKYKISLKIQLFI